MKVKFIAKFMDWKVGEVADISKAAARRYIGLAVCEAVKPPAKKKKKETVAPKNRRAAARKTK